MITSPTRGPYQGVLQILRFNRRMYFVAAAGIVTAALVWPFLPPFGRSILIAGATPSLFWMLSSLIVSHYVYDRSSLYDFRGIARMMSRAPRRWINIHSGWDETSELLAELFPESCGQVVDIFDARVMTESSIQQARRQATQARHDRIPATEAHYDALPFAADSFDAAFSIFAAHELRHHQQRVRLFREVGRILSPDGELILVEHARDWKNFLAFGPGFLHFFSRRAWQNTAAEAGLALRTELTVTPFVHVYFLRRE